MAQRRLRTLGKLAGWSFVGLAALVVGVLLFAWSGIYSVAASRGHWAVVDWFLAFGMRNSVELRAMAIKTPPLQDVDLIRLGAGHFHGGCAFCHGAPGIPVSPIARQMLPSPPDLATSMRHWTDAELFWIVKHGIKYTGMPGWVALEREDEIWAVVAFLRELPKLEPEKYREIALGTVQLSGQTGKELATVDSNQQAAGACARCHGAGGTGPVSALIPVLHGQPAEFLARALKEYAEGTRRSGVMQPLAAGLDQQEVRRLAAYYARLAKPQSKPRSADAQLIERGRHLAEAGDAANGIPTCNVCHTATALAEYPRLAGQSASYMAGQLALWRSSHHTSTGTGAIMAPIARRLSADDAAAVTAYFASLRAEPAGARRQ
jgi:cytochrome c553